MSDIRDFSPLWGVWEVDTLLGQGSYGKVYRAKREEFGSTFYAAVKHLSIPNETTTAESLYAEGLLSDTNSMQDYCDKSLERLIKEITINASLKGHTNIVSYEDHLVVPKKDCPGYDIFIRMELLTSLTDAMMGGRLNEEEVVKIGVDICTALTVLERADIIHRDIKPGNIFINANGDYELGDFGVARDLERTASGMTIAGTLNYMAPEINKGGTVGRNADLYSLGLVMYRLFNSNRAPFLPVPPATVDFNDNEAANARRFAGEQFPPPAYAPPQVARVILKACQADAAARYGNAEEMKQALLACASGETNVGDETLPLVQTRPVPPQPVPQPIPTPVVPEKKRKQDKLKLIVIAVVLFVVVATVATLLASGSFGGSGGLGFAKSYDNCALYCSANGQYYSEYDDLNLVERQTDCFLELHRSNGKSVSADEIAWSSSDSSLLTVDSYGNLTVGWLSGYYEQSVLVTAQAGDVCFSTNVKIHPRYEVILDDCSWQTAKMACDNLGGHLATITDDTEFTQICNLLDNIGIPRAWLGGETYYDEYGNLEGKWITEESFSCNNWFSGEPSGFDSGVGIYEDKIQLLRSSKLGWGMNDSTESPFAYEEYAKIIANEREKMSTGYFMSYVCEYEGYYG